MKKAAELVKAYILSKLRRPLATLFTVAFASAVFLFGFILNPGKTASITASYSVFLLAYTSAVLLGLTISQDRHSGMYRMIRTTKITKIEYVQAKALISNIGGLLMAATILSIGVLTTEMHVKPLLQGLVLVMTAVSHIGIGLILGSYFKKEKHIQMAGSAIMMVMAILSPVFYSLETLPDFLRFLPQLVPLTYSIQAMRQVTVTGAGLSEIITPLAVLALVSILTVPVGYRKLDF
ncbi:MAG: ABC transporter permease [Candidatus Nanohalobium sp.]